MSYEVSTPGSAKIHARRSSDPNHRTDGTSPRRYVPPPARDRVRWPAALLPWQVVGTLQVSQARRRRPCCRRASPDHAKPYFGSRVTAFLKYSTEGTSRIPL